MNSKWYMGALLIILTFIGLNNEQNKAANQQLVLQFTEADKAELTDHDAVLALVTKKLRVLGVAHIEVIENDDTQLSIQYYSDIDANSIGDFLSQDGELAVFYEDIDQLPDDFPKDKLPETCSIVVSDLQQADYGTGLNGKLAVELNQDYKRLSNPVVIRFDDSICIGQDVIVKVALKINRGSTITSDTTSYTIPEVRAGPHFDFLG